MGNETPQVSDDVKIMAGIGHACLQWARLEMGILGVIYTIEDMPAAKGELIFGGLDMLPRINMAIKLAEYAKIPMPLQKRLKAIRKELQEHLNERRNQVVHGAHKNMGNGETVLTMVRWRGDKREKVITPADLYQLGAEICDLGSECWAIMEDLGTWKFGPHRKENLDDALA